MNLRVAFTVTVAGVLSWAALQAQFKFPSSDHDHRIARERVRDHIIRHVTEHIGPPSLAEQPSDPCADAGWDDDHDRACDVREYRLPAGPLNVDAGNNGGIRVEGWDRDEIRVQAVVTASAREEEYARQLASQVEVQAGSGRVTATGPVATRREWWSVSYRISVPHRNDLDLKARNGGITIDGVHGTIRFATRNGGIHLRDLGGDVQGETHNGGLNVTLTGDRWDGLGLDVQTANGGVDLAIPDGYNAALATRTVNGRFRTQLPMTVQGELPPRRGIETTLGSGGPPVRVRTTNGGLRIRRR